MVLIVMQRKYNYTRYQINSFDKFLDGNQLDIEIEF